MTTKILLALVFLGNTLLFAQKEGAVQGKVSAKENSAGVAYAGVILKKDGRILAKTRADVDGHYSFSRLRPGVYTLKANVADYYCHTVLNLRIDSAMVEQNMEIEASFIPGEVTVKEKPSTDIVNLVEIESASVEEVPSVQTSAIVSPKPVQENAAMKTQPASGGIAELARPAITVYPNPINERAVIEIASEIDVTGGTVRLYNIAGIEVRTLFFIGKTVTFERQGLGAGVYMYHVTSQERSIATGRMVIL